MAILADDLPYRGARRLVLVTGGPLAPTAPLVALGLPKRQEGVVGVVVVAIFAEIAKRATLYTPSCLDVGHLDVVGAPQGLGGGEIWRGAPKGGQEATGGRVGRRGCGGRGGRNGWQQSGASQDGVIGGSEVVEDWPGWCCGCGGAPAATLRAA